MPPKRKKVVIEYPPLTLRKWRPPLKDRPWDPFKKKKFLRKPIYPPKHVILKPTLLHKVWHRYKRLTPSIFLLRGNYNQQTWKYVKANRGKQHPASCIACIGYLQCCPPEFWNEFSIDRILDIGDKIYTNSCLVNKSKSCNCMKEIFATFYIGYLHLVIGVDMPDPIKGKLFEDKNNKVYLYEALKEYFISHNYCIVELEGRMVTIFKNKGGYWIFDPEGRDELGEIFRRQEPHLNDNCVTDFPKNLAAVLRYVSLKSLSLNLEDNVKCKDTNLDFIIHPIIIKRKETRCFAPPKSLESFSARRRFIANRIKKDEIAMKTIQSAASVDFAPKRPSSVEPPDPERLQELARKPIEKPKQPSVTYFTDIFTNKIGIMRAGYHQNDANFSKYYGKQSLANAVAAIAMLREHKSRYWIKKTLDDILVTGEQIYYDSKKKLAKDQVLGLKELTDRIMINQNQYTPLIEETTVIGKLTSFTFGLLELLPALEEFFANNDTGIIRGPQIIAVWREQDRYYLFDPNDRTKDGKVIPICKKPNEEEDVIMEEPEEGFACLLWFASLEELSNLYMVNTPLENVRDPFVISKVEIKDYIGHPEGWNNFKAVEYGKWILRGTINQSDKMFSEASRNTQATAMAAMALTFVALQNIETWERKTIDEILETGDTLYKECTKSLESKEKFLSPQLMVNELVSRFSVRDTDIQLLIEECKVNGILNVPDTHEVANLKLGLETFFKSNSTGVITAKGLSVALWKDDDAYYTYDSHARDDNGFDSVIGTACAMRFLNQEDLVDVLQSNFEPDTTSLYNIHRVVICQWDNIGGVTRPTLYNYQELCPKTAIVRSTTYEGDKDTFDIYIDKQTIPNILVSFGMNAVFPANLWSQRTLDEILQIGEKLYEDSKTILLNREVKKPEVTEEGELIVTEEEPEEPPVPETDEVILENVLKEFKIGVNKFTIEFGEQKKGVFEEDPQLKRSKFRSSGTLKKLLTQFLDEEGEEVKSAVIKNDFMTVGVWREDGVFYLFDPKGRDQMGNVIGRELWSAKVYPPEPMGEEMEGEEYNQENTYNVEKGGGDTAVAPLTPVAEVKPAPSVRVAPAVATEEEIAEEEVEVEEEDMSLTISSISLDMSNAKAFAMQFITVESLAEHIIENVPPNKRADQFTMVPILLDNRADVKLKTDEIVKTAGDWNQFIEIDIEHWILRGNLNMENSMYPICNRGQQYATMCITSLAFSNLFDMAKFKTTTINDILKYGDRMHTLIVKSRIQDIKNHDLDLTEVEVCFILNQQKVETKDIMKTFLIGDWKVDTEIKSHAIEGDLNAEDTNEEILSLKNGLEKFLNANPFGIFSAKELSVAVFKVDDFYYMFDPDSRGPNGIIEKNGTACITRHKTLDTMVKIIQQNLPKEFANVFHIDAITFTCEFHEKPQPEIKKVITINPKITAYDEITPGKLILSGNFNLNNPKFAKNLNATCCANALVALGMARIHKPVTWTKPIIDDVLTNGNMLFDLSKDDLGYSFNPWEDYMNLDLVNKEFNLGVKHVKCEFGEDLQHGILNIKHPIILNLRRALENFFDDNVYGVVQSECQTTAVWTENDLFYMFDPYPRSNTGLYQNGGNACLLVFKNIKYLTDHFMNNIPEKMKDSEFVVTPVKIILSKCKEPKKKPMLKCEILQCKDIPIFASTEKLPEKIQKPKKPKPVQKEPETDKLEIRDCHKAVLEKKEWARNVSIQKNKKEDEKLLKLMRREFYKLNEELSILRAHYSQNSRKFSKNSRNMQAIPNALVAIVMSKLHEPNTWTYKNIEIILDSADVLYKDSWWFYKPYNPELGLKNVLRTFYIQCEKFTTFVYKPAILGDMAYRALYVGLLNFFLHETAGIIITSTISLAVFQKAGQYFIFDPYDRDREGKPVRCGTACLLRFTSIEVMAKKLLDNAECCKMFMCIGKDCHFEGENRGKYSIHAVSMEQERKPVPPEIVKSLRSCRTAEIV